MTDEKIKQLLQSADRMAGSYPSAPENLANLVRKRATRNRHIKFAVLPAAAVFLLAFAGLTLFTRTGSDEQQLSEIQAAQLREEVRDLNMRIDATVKLVSEVLERQERLERIAQLNTQLAGFIDPSVELEENLDTTAFLLLNQADNSYQRYNDIDSAVQAYNRIIELFPNTASAERAKLRIKEIQKKFINDYI